MPATSPGLANLLHWWSMDEDSGNRIDYHGGNTLIDNNTVGSTPGVIGLAADYTAANSEYFELTSLVDFADQATRSIVWWVNVDRLATHRMQFANVHDGAGNDFRVFIRSGSGDLTVVNDANSDSETFAIGLSATTTYFLVMTFLANRNVYVYVDSVATDSPRVLNPSDGGIKYLGQQGNDTLYMDGWQDEFAIFDDVLTQDEIDWLYNGGAGRSYEEFLTSVPTKSAPIFF